jgi:hypothetical protein
MCCEDGDEIDFPERCEPVRRQRVPGEETMVRAVLHDLFLELDKSFLSFTIK